jgi:hypothetical protein
MKVIFRFEDNKGQIILEASTPIDQANINNFLDLKGNNISISPGTRKELILESIRKDETPVKSDL